MEVSFSDNLLGRILVEMENHEMVVLFNRQHDFIDGVKSASDNLKYDSNRHSKLIYSIH